MKPPERATMSRPDIGRIAATLEKALSESEIDELGKATGQSKRLRIVTPFRLLSTLLGALGDGTTETIADLCREFNFRFETTTAYKAFYNRLAHPGFSEFTMAVVSRLLTQLATKVLEPQPGSPLAQFTDIVIQDGTSFALKRSLRHVFPGRFTTVEPAAVELHATLSGFYDEVVEVSLSPDTTQERAFLPHPTDLAGQLLLADRGYPSRNYLAALDSAGASFIMRLSGGFKPYVRAVHRGKRIRRFPQPIALSTYLQRSSASELDLDIELRKNKVAVFSGRLVILSGDKASRIHLCTNLSRKDFPLELVDRLYRFRWQIELLFKEWKSYANLRKFDTGNEHIAEGLIWATLAAAILKRFLAHSTQQVRRCSISTRKVAMCARSFLRQLLTVLAAPSSLRATLTEIIDYLARNARRANPTRDRERGRLSSGLAVCWAAK
jgi:hypothetical protein